MNNASKVLVIAANEPLRHMMRNDNPSSFIENTEACILIFHYTFRLFLPPHPRSMFFSTSPAPSLQHDGQSIARQSGLWCCSHLRWAKRRRRKKIYDKIWWLTQVVYFTGLLVLWVRTANQGGCACACVCVCVCVWLQYLMVCLPGALCCGAVMLSVTVVRPEPCSQRNQLWSWQVCLLHTPTTLFPRFHTHKNTHRRSYNEAHTQTQKNAHSFMAWGLSTHAPTTSPLPTSTHIHRQSHKLQAASLMPATNTLQKEYAHRALLYSGYTHSTHPRNLIKMSKHETVLKHSIFLQYFSSRRQRTSQ